MTTLNNVLNNLRINELNKVICINDGDIILLDQIDNKEINENNLSKCFHKYCNKCYQKNKYSQEISNIDIFNQINNIVFNSISMPDVHNKIDNMIIPFEKWLELNENGYSVFHWFAWFICTKIKKYRYLKPRVYAFFQKVFSDNTINSIFTEKEISIIINLSTNESPNHTLLYHLVRYCENPNDIFYRRLYQLLIDNGATPINNELIYEIKNKNTEEENLPDDLKKHVSNITNKYKYI